MGDRVMFKVPHKKGYGSWRPGFIIARKPDYQYIDGIRGAHGYTIYDRESTPKFSAPKQEIN